MYTVVDLLCLASSHSLYYIGKHKDSSNYILVLIMYYQLDFSDALVHYMYILYTNTLRMYSAGNCNLKSIFIKLKSGL